MSEQSTIKVEIGSIVAASGGLTRDTRQQAELQEQWRRLREEANDG